MKNIQFLSIVFYTAEKVVFNTAWLAFAVHGVNVAIEIGCVFGIDLAGSFGDIEFIVLVARVKNAEFLAVGRYEEHIVTAICEKTDLLTLRNTDVHDYNTARLQMADSLVKLRGLRVIYSEFFGNYRS